ncbi:MAG: hypothetical protein OEY44_00855 [Candidatus Peregrinibacteria bacterium]|nr:hypothetical protein [Candidatus Peregrinibacteria bacterium]
MTQRRGSAEGVPYDYSFEDEAPRVLPEVAPVAQVVQEAVGDQGEHQWLSPVLPPAVSLDQLTPPTPQTAMGVRVKIQDICDASESARLLREKLKENGVPELEQWTILQQVAVEGPSRVQQAMTRDRLEFLMSYTVEEGTVYRPPGRDLDPAAVLGVAKARDAEEPDSGGRAILAPDEETPQAKPAKRTA